MSKSIKIENNYIHNLANLLRSLLALLIALLAFLTFTVGCNSTKVPIRPLKIDLQIISTHWFEQEKVSYFFYRIKGESIMSHNFQLEWTDTSQKDKYKILDLNQGVHTHAQLDCGTDLCGSFSFYSDTAPEQIFLRLKYHERSSMYVEADSFVQKHRHNDSGDSFSALFYGVFDKNNQHIQLRFVNNFGSPSDSEISQYGLSRNFKINHLNLTSADSDELSMLKITSQNSYLFPALVCREDQVTINLNQSITEPYTWVNSDIGNSPNSYTGVCINISGLSKDYKELFKTFSLARKNPKVYKENIQFKTPLKDTLQIPIAVFPCPNDEKSANLFSPLFFEYQNFIMGFQNLSNEKICFKLGNEINFQNEFKNKLVTDLQKFKTSNQQQQYDFIFKIIINHKFNSEFQRIQEIVLEVLNQIIESEKFKISPRLVGGFIYDSTAEFNHPLLASQSIVWCPQKNVPVGSELMGDDNCLVDDGGVIKNSLFNFLIPMGPFPTRANYEAYVQKHGDRGLSKNPKLKFISVPANEFTQQDESQMITYFESQKLILNENEALRICSENDNEFLLSQIRFKKINSTEPAFNYLQGLNIFNADKNGGNFKIGVSWSYAFWGAVYYNLPVTGSVIGIIPFKKDIQSHKEVGDKKWIRPLWNLNNIFEHCTDFCDHPYFDEAGVYQLDSIWRDRNSSQCINSMFPEKN